MMDIEAENEQKIILSKSPSCIKEVKSESKNGNLMSKTTLTSSILNLSYKFSSDTLIRNVMFYTSPNRKVFSKKSKKRDLELYNGINQIYQNFDPLTIIKTLYSEEIRQENNEIINIKSEPNNEVKVISMESTNEDENFIDIDNFQNDKSTKLNNDCDCVIKDEKENTKGSDEINENEIKISPDDIIIDINDNYIDSESKNETNMEISDEELNSSNYLEINPNTKFNIKNISYHCSIIDGNYYKYKKLEEPIEKNRIKFICYNEKCESFGFYNIKDKTFELWKPHWDGYTIHCYQDLMSEKDMKNYNYMIYNNVNEIQMYDE